MKFDRARNSAELRELFEYLQCIAIGSAIAVIIGMPLFTTSVLLVFAFRHWKKQGALNSRIRLLGGLLCFGALLNSNWTSYCKGVEAGCAAAAATSTSVVKNKAA